MTNIPKGGFTNSAQLEDWMNSLPAQNIQPFATALTHRAAMRVLPYMWRFIHAGKAPYSQQVLLRLAIFRANLISGIAVTYPTPKIKAAAAAASDAAASAAAYAAADPHFLAFPAAANFAFVAAPAATAATEWQALSSDVLFLQNGATVAQLVASPLWLERQAVWWHEVFTNFQLAFSALDESTNSNWSVWLDWYNARINGRPAFDLPPKIAEALEMRIALGDNREDFWNREPHEINTEIAG